MARSADGISSTWAGAGTTDFADVSVEQLESRLQERLAWSTRRLERPAGRYDVLLPPEAVSDLMVGLAYELSGRNAEDGRTVFSLPGGGTRVGEQLSPVPFDLRSDPGLEGLECSPFLAATASSADTSVFDNGLPLDPIGWISRRAPPTAALPPGRGQPLGDRPGRVHRQSHAGGARGDRVAGGDGGPDRTRPAAHLPLVHP